jgi:hypothetical protein
MKIMEPADQETVQEYEAEPAIAAHYRFETIG